MAIVVRSGSLPGASGAEEAALRAAVAHAVLAPSNHNSQPWLFGIGDGALRVRADRSRALPVVDPFDRELVISCGAALLNARLALRGLGYATTVEVLPDRSDPDLLACLHLAGRRVPTTADLQLVEAIPRRRTNRRPFAGEPLPDDLV